ncbi:MAG: hypothetical protein KC421_13170, partial [Anaerolineales bacterium]|nr:hypothetical protein [Anaerolineales bacterium]
LAFVPIWGVMALLPLYKKNRTQMNTEPVLSLSKDKHSFFSSSVPSVVNLLKFLSAGLASIVVVWAVFGFEWGPFLFQTGGLAGLNAVSGPMPTFWAGIEKIVLLSGGGRGAYLLGEYSTAGFLAYFPIAFVVKTPLVTLVGLVITAVLLIKQPRTRKRALFVLTVPLLYFELSMVSRLNIGYRHLLPVLPFVYLLAAGLVDWSTEPKRQRQARVGLVGWLVGLLVAVMWIHPHYLSFFNVAAGGPANGHTILLDSNIDWGQDLFRLQDWMADQGVEKVKLGWFGTAVPSYYHLNYEPLPGFPYPEFISQWGSPPFDVTAPEPGIYAISVSNLMELPLPHSGVYAWFRTREPDTRIGYSIWIYRVE